MKKGITPVISIIILVTITVALSATAWTFLQGFIYPQISKSFLVPPESYYCTKNASGTFIKVFVQNTGYQSDLVVRSVNEGGDFILAQVDDQDALKTMALPTIDEGKSGMILDHKCAVSCDQPGYHTVSIATISTVQHFSVFCP